MSTVKEPEVIDLDFTYGDEYVHFGNGPWDSDRIRGTHCGAPRSHPHRGHWRIVAGEPAPTVCTCGVPICPVCLHVYETETGIR